MALGRRSASGERCTLLVINEADGSWSFHGLGTAVEVTLSKADTIAVAESCRSWRVPGDLILTVDGRPRHSPWRALSRHRGR